MQLDIFDDSRDVMLRNDVLQALERRDAAAAARACEQLAAEYPDDASCAPCAQLVAALAQADAARDAPPFADATALAAARRPLDERVAPAARHAFGDRGAADWMAPLWRGLAQRALRVGFDAGRPDDHAAPLFLRAGDAQAAADAVAAIASWQRIPAPLAWMAEARYRADAAHGIDAAWPLLVELAWLAPARFDALARRLGDPLLERLRRGFGRGFETPADGKGATDDWAWFPAWVLTEQPALCAVFRQAQPGLHGRPEQAMRCLLELLGLERQGRHADVVARRRVLRDLHAGLYAAYMATR